MACRIFDNKTLTDRKPTYCYRWIPCTKLNDAKLWCFSLVCAWISGWLNNGQACDSRRHRAHYDVTLMATIITADIFPQFKCCILYDNVFDFNWNITDNCVWECSWQKSIYWRRYQYQQTGDKPLSQPLVTQPTKAFLRHVASMSGTNTQAPCHIESSTATRKLCENMSPSFKKGIFQLPAAFQSGDEIEIANISLGFFENNTTRLIIFRRQPRIYNVVQISNSLWSSFPE